MEATKRKATTQLTVIVILILLIVITLFFILLPFIDKQNNTQLITIYGNIDIRQVQLAFYNEGRIGKLLVQEGDFIHAGQPLAALDPTRITTDVVKARAAIFAQEATLANAKRTLDRQRLLVATQAASKQTVDDAEANLNVAQQTLAADQASLLLAEQVYKDSTLLAPQDGVIQDRILEVGDMVNPQTPVFTVALTNPVWARAYLDERDLGRIRLGMLAYIETDSFPGKKFKGWVGFISPTSEFTPKNVETPELRTDLVYQVRIFACNPKEQLRLGMPVTVQIPLNQPLFASRGANPCGK